MVILIVGVVMIMVMVITITVVIMVSCTSGDYRSRASGRPGSHDSIGDPGSLTVPEVVRLVCLQAYSTN